MLIAISGPSSCGKTTLLQTLIQEQNNLTDSFLKTPFQVLNRQFARELLLKLNLNIQRDFHSLEVIKNFQEELLEYKLEVEKEFFESDDLWFTERSFLDFFVFFKLYLQQFPDQSLDLSSYKTRCIELSKRYKSIIYLEEIPKREDDSLRIIEKNHLLQQKLLFKNLFQTNSFSSLFLLKEKELSSRKEDVFCILSSLSFFKS